MDESGDKPAASGKARAREHGERARGMKLAREARIESSVLPDDPHPPEPVPPTPLPPTPQNPRGVPPAIDDPHGPVDPTPVREPPSHSPPAVAVR